ncbi:MAG: hypothetical protein EAZ53_06095 [Bacteroidetes bacterium]|nr:MAG: hypothetical protein EAZ53_06095 [Bacteroidota bacterium]
MFKLNEASKASIFEDTGISFDEFKTLSASEIDSRVEKKIGKRLTFPNSTDERFQSRGSVFLFLNRFLR